MFNLLAGSDLGSYFMIVGLIAVIVLFMVLNARTTKKRQEEQQKVLDAIRPGNKVKTIGGVCGIVVEVNAEDNSFVLETGTEKSGKSYIKFDKQAVYQTDAVVEKAAAPQPAAEEPKAEVEETPASVEEPVVEETEEKQD